MTFSVAGDVGYSRFFEFAGVAATIPECRAPPPLPPCRGHDDSYDYPEGYLQIDFFEASLKVNNLGGYCANAGDTNDCTAIVDGQYDSSEPVLLYTNVGKLRKAAYPGYVPAPGADLTTVHLKVEVAPGSEYVANNGANINGFGRNNAFGEINLGGRSADMTHGDHNEATFIFTLLDGGVDGVGATNEPIEGLNFFAFSYFDFDHSENGDNGQECLTLLEPSVGEDKYDIAAAGSNVQCNNVPECDKLACENSCTASASNVAPKFCSRKWGTNADNPALPSDMGTPSIDDDGMTVYGDDGDPVVQAQAVMFEFRNTNVMKVTYSVKCCISTGRNFLFAGATSPLTPCESPPPSLPLVRSPSPPQDLATNVACLPIRSDEALLDFSGAKPQRFPTLLTPLRLSAPASYPCRRGEPAAQQPGRRCRSPLCDGR